MKHLAIMNYLTTILLALAIIASLALLKGCTKKDTPPAPTEEELLEEQLAEDAAYNGSILSGAGNFFVNSGLRASQDAQQVGALSLLGDSVVLLGSTDGAGKVEVVHTAGVFPNDGTPGALAQVSADGNAVSVSAMGGTERLNPVLVVRRMGTSGTEVTLREYAADGSYTALASGYYENGDLQAGQLLMNADPAPSGAGGCALPKGTGGTYGHLADVSYVRCMLQWARADAASFLASYTASGGSYDVEGLQEASDRLLETLGRLDRLDELRTHAQPLGNGYAGLVDTYTVESASAGETTVTGLELSPAAPAYSERDGGELSFQVVVVDTATRGAQTGEPAYAKVRLTSSDGSNIYLDEVRAIDTGATEIRFDPRALEDYGTAESLSFSYGLVSDSTVEEVSIPLMYIVPSKISIKSGNNQEVKMLQEVPELLAVVVTATDGFPVEGIKVVWEVTKGGGHFGGNASPSVEAVTDETGAASAPVKWGLGRKGEQEVKATAYYKGDAIGETVFKASVYQPKRELVYFTGLDDHNGVPLEERNPVRTVKEGQRFEAYHNVAYNFRVKEDGKFVHLGGREILTAFTDGRGPWLQRAGDPSLLEDYEIAYINGQGYQDTLRIDVVVKNTLHDLVVGRTLKQRFLNGDITYYEFHKGGSVAIYHNNNMQTETKTYVLTIDEPVGQRGNLFANAYTLWFCGDYTYHEPNIGVVYIGAERGKGISDYDLSILVQRLYVNENGKLTFMDGGSGGIGCSEADGDYLLEWAD